MTMTMNEIIWSDPKSFPAVTDVVPGIIGSVAQSAASQLGIRHAAYVDLQPGDGTRYELVIIANPDLSYGAPYRFASQSGPLAPWLGETEMHPDYALEKYVMLGGYWSATVIALFLNTVGDLVKLSDDLRLKR